MSCSAHRRAKEEHGAKEGERLFSCRVSPSYPTKNPASVIQIFLQASGLMSDCRHDYPRDSLLQQEMEMRARESIMNFLCSHRQELSLISFSGCSTSLSYTGQWNLQGSRTRSGRTASGPGHQTWRTEE